MLVSVAINIGKIDKLPNGRNDLSGGVSIYIYDGKKHRQGGPAEINTRTGYRAWFKHGLLHRVSGPALINPVEKYKEFWEKGILLRREPL